MYCMVPNVQSQIDGTSLGQNVKLVTAWFPLANVGSLMFAVVVATEEVQIYTPGCALQ